jgi:hypothetical protein
LKPASSKEMLQGIRNVDRADGKPFDATFDWRTPFKVGGKWVLVPVTPSPDVEKTRQKMLRMLGGTQLAQEVLSKMASLTETDRAERAAWILEGGKLGPIRQGTVQKVDFGPEPPRAVGAVHIHPSQATSLEPPSGPGSTSDYDATLKDAPLQFVVESASGRTWGQFPPDLTSLLGRIRSPGSFQPLVAEDPVAKLAYKVVPIDYWHEMEDKREQEEWAKQKERLKQQLLKEQKAKQKPQ